MKLYGTAHQAKSKFDLEGERHLGDLWNRPAPAAEKPKATPVLGSAEEVASQSHQLLADQGWCLWRCSALGGDVIIIVIDETVTGYPAGYLVYTLQEISEVADLDDRLLRAAHEAKKGLGAKIAGVEVTSP